MGSAGDSYDNVLCNSFCASLECELSDRSVGIFAKEIYAGSGMMYIRAVGSLTHFRGYIDREMVVNGHGDAPPADSGGLKFEGTGTVMLDRIALTNL